MKEYKVKADARHIEKIEGKLVRCRDCYFYRLYERHEYSIPRISNRANQFLMIGYLPPIELIEESEETMKEGE